MRDKKIWIFNATNDFVGNPKWLFIYMNRFRKDIETYWMCDNEEVIERIKKMGFNAELYSSKKSEKIKEKAGVFVVHQVKEHFPVKFKNEVIILNLWHGVGLKPIERYVDSPKIKYRTYKKYIKYNSLYHNNQLFLVTSPLMEEHFKKMLNLDEEQIIRSGYPVNMFNKNSFNSFNYNFVSNKKKDKNTKIALYAPTFRDYKIDSFFNDAIPDISKLIGVLEKNNIILILKMHYLVNNDPSFKAFKELYKNHPNLIFWNNHYDIYEIFNYIDIAIIDYSSIFYDLLTSNVSKFIRYIYDYDKYTENRNLIFEYKKMTSGEIAHNFKQLLELIENINLLKSDTMKNKQIINDFWQYDSNKNNGFEKIINETLNFNIRKEKLPKLYSFDIFDTILQRKTLKPEGIFFYVKEKLLRLENDIPFYVIQNYPRVRIQAENYVRDYYKKSKFIREENRLEIRFIDIINRIKYIYDLTEAQSELLYDLEIEAELENIEAKQDKLDILYKLLNNNEKVILISDMYLPRTIIDKMLNKVDSRLSQLPVYLSSELGNQKSTGLLFLDIFEDLDYDYSSWIHYGDNKHADFIVPKKLNIKPILHKPTTLNNYENQMINRNKNYDMYLLVNLLAKFRNENQDELSYYVYAYISSYLVPYVNWSINKALKEKINTLYFISRDGDLLKKIADEIIKVNGYNIKTKHIYGSRKAWRIPSFINDVDEEFFSPFGNFTGLTTFESVLNSLELNENEFNELFPELQYIKKMKSLNKNSRELVRLSAKQNLNYRKLLLTKAAEKRKIINKYLEQEINFEEKFAFVEYWGRGYTQDCLNRLINNICSTDIDIIFFYARSIYPSFGTSIRFNYTSKMTSLVFIESIFNNLPYKSVSGYKFNQHKIEPIIAGKEYDKHLYNKINEILPKFINDFYSLNFVDLDEIERNFYDFGVDYFKNKPEDPLILKYFAPLKDSVVLFEPEQEYAPPITYKMAAKKLLGKRVELRSKNKKMSLKRSPKGVQLAYNIYNNKIKNNKISKKIYKYIRKR